MKHFKLFLLSLAVFGISISGVNAQNYYGFYTGAVHATSSLLGIDESFGGIIVKLGEDDSGNYLQFEDFDFAGLELPKLDSVNITPNGTGGYSISRTGSINITIPEIILPPYPPLFPGGTFTNVPVVVTFKNGSIVDNEMTLNIEAIATLQIIPPIPFSIPVNIQFVGTLPIQELIYDPVAVARIIDMIDNNDLKADREKPETWEFAGWMDDGDTLQLIDLDLRNEGLLGSLSLVGLSRLESLDCANNHLTAIILTGCTHLEELYCYLNHLTAIDLSNLDALTEFAGDAQTIELTLDNDGNGNFICAIPLNEPTFDEPAISYEAGILQSTDPTIASTGFTVETGNSEFQLSGMMSFTYTGVGIAETVPALSVQVYPNPTNDELRVTSDELRVTSIEVYDVYGKKVSQISYPKSHISNLIDISHLQAGSYLLRINTEKGSIMQKVVKQ